MSSQPDQSTPEDDLNPVSPADVASASRSCQAIVLILLALAAIGCVIVAVAVLR